MTFHSAGVDPIGKLLQKPPALIFFFSAWVVLTSNAAFWRIVLADEPGGGLPHAAYVALVGMLVIGLVSLVLLLLTPARLTRYVVAALLLTSAAVSYFTAGFGVLFDGGMLVNVLETSTAEASELMSWPLLATLVFAGLLPAVAALLYPLRYPRLPRALLDRGVALLLACALIAAPLIVAQREIASLGRNHREVRHLIAPINVLSASLAVLQDRFEAPAEHRQLALDASRVEPLSGGGSRPNVHVLIVGETARAANFSIAGYTRTTNPILEARADIDYFDISACGTATAVSLPCMFALEPKARFKRQVASHEDNLLDVASRAGYAVHWIDNGNGCKGLCARVDHRDVHDANVAGLCESDACFDEILVHELRKQLAEVQADTLIVLHQLGSHGPAYYRRYPERFRRFVPDCRSQNLGDCSTEEITNSYDNTILYTDYVIAAAIDALAAHSDRFDASLVYLSDHGESLGEHNLYLHGMPYRLAPSEQTRVPMITWSAPSAETRLPRHSACGNAGALSHDNLFHTELGLLGIRTSVYRRDLDIYSSCRVAGTITAANDTARGRT